VCWRISRGRVDRALASDDGAAANRGRIRRADAQSFTLKDLDPNSVTGIIISSVVPPVNSTLGEMARIYFDRKHSSSNRE